MSEPFLNPAARPAPIVLAIVGLCALFEIAFTLADTPLIDFPTLRNMALVYGAFWPGLLQDWQPVFPGQPLTMFVSYAFLHGSFLHMLFNMLILMALARQAVVRLGQGGFLLAYVLCSIGGAGAYYLLSTTGAPMLGASGAVFGLFGMQIFWDIQARRARGLPLDPPIRLAIGLVVMNVLLWALVAGMLAWQAHLGGFVTGAALAATVTPTLGHRHRR
ncbi:MAG: rhomboid family intramembrane serine protease [Rhodobacteraceae bacterium]|nr:rhomboid family intramembrane serine protease [Paracoccaceae bacterium]